MRTIRSAPAHRSAPPGEAMTIQNDMKLVVREVTDEEETRIRELAAQLGLPAAGIQRIYPDAPTSKTGNTEFIPPRTFSLVIYVMGESPSRKLAELIDETLGKECLVEAL